MNMIHDNIVFDVGGPTMAAAMEHARNELAFRPYWSARAVWTENDPWHWSAPIDLSSGDALARLWDEVTNVLVVPPGARIHRAYVAGYTMGTDGAIHVDHRDADAVAVTIYLHPEWDANWGGELALFAADEIAFSVLPKPGRVFAFRGCIPHAARPVSRLSRVMRVAMVVKLLGWPEACKIARRI